MYSSPRASASCCSSWMRSRSLAFFQPASTSAWWAKASSQLGMASSWSMVTSSSRSISSRVFSFSTRALASTKIWSTSPCFWSVSGAGSVGTYSSPRASASCCSSWMRSCSLDFFQTASTSAWSAKASSQLGIASSWSRVTSSGGVSCGALDSGACCGARCDLINSSISRCRSSIEGRGSDSSCLPVFSDSF